MRGKPVVVVVSRSRFTDGSCQHGSRQLLILYVVSFLAAPEVNEGGTNNKGTYMRRIEVAVRTAEDRAVTAKIFLFEDLAHDFSAEVGDLLIFGNLARKGSDTNLVFWAGSTSYVAKAFVGPNTRRS